MIGFVAVGGTPTLQPSQGMYGFTHANLIWNRACGANPMRSLPGDRALTDLLKAHGLSMNGGVLHAVECLSDEELAAAISGYRYYSFDATADLLSRAKEMLSTDNDLDVAELHLDLEYATLIPSDSTLVDRFEWHFQFHPTAYAFLRAEDRSG